MPSNSSLLEDLISSKQGLGADYKFERDTLEVKLNRHGVSGVFTRRALAEGTEIISIPVINGSLTPFRSYEEAQEMLQKLGSSRFNVSHEFAIACAMYLRCRNVAESQSDLLVTENDLTSSYSGSPMTSYGSLARAKLISSNNRVEIEKAAETDEQIRLLNVDPDLFRALFGYISSRSWKGAGVIPVLDWFNASYANGANCDFSMREGKFSYVSIRKIAEGEELVWNYNNANAVTTWFNYGYVDDERPTLAFLEVRIGEEERFALENFAIKKLHFARNKVSSNLKIDKCLFQRELLTPGTLSNAGDAQRAIANCVTNFVSVRAWFRMLVLSGETEISGPVSYANMSSDEFVFGSDIERRVIGSMRIALANGLAKNRERIEEFIKSDIGRSIDMEPYINILTHANGAWDEALTVVEDICLMRGREELVPLINAFLNLDIKFADDIRPALDRIDTERPSLTASLMRKYAQMLS